MRTILAALAALVSVLSAADLLYNGVGLPEVWPPRDVKLTQEPLPRPPYLLEPPHVIPIDVGRQLFVDDFLIESTDLRRTFHRPDYFKSNPVLKADKPWEFVEGVGKAMPFSDGVFWDPSDNLFKAWYLSVAGTLYATSRDGVRWDKPALDIRPGTNVVHTAKRDSACVWLDLDERDPRRRYKFLYMPGHMQPATLHYSPDGVHWGDPVAKSIPWSDRTTFFRNPFRNVWVFSLRDHDWTPGQPESKEHLGRLRRYQENADMAAGLAWKQDEPVSWVSADRLDARRVDLNAQPQLYNLDAVAYESLMVGLFTIWRGQFTDREKPNEITVGFTRDGFHWYRPDRNAFLPISDRFGDWNYSNVQSAGGVLLVVGDRLYFYVSGRAGAQGARTSGATTMGLATLRRDGFASMDATQPGQLTTRPVRFAGKHLFLNVESDPGELLVEVLDRNGRVLPGFSKADCLPVQIDNTAQLVRWKGRSDLSALAGQPVRFRFLLRDARLYSFWVSPSESGASMGYVGAGGPGIPGNRDMVGTQAYHTCCKGSTW